MNPIPAEVEVLADAIEQQTGERPDELCPAFLACLGIMAGPPALAVARQVLDGLALPETFEADALALWDRLIKRRSRHEPFVGLLQAEVWSALAWHLQGLSQLTAVGLCDDPNAAFWEYCRTLYTTRQGEIFEIRHDGSGFWRTHGRDLEKLRVPVRSKVLRELVQAPKGARIDPRLVEQGWRMAGTNLLRDQTWTEHSRRKRAEAIAAAEAHAGPPAPRRPHKWGPGGIENYPGIERCQHCGTARWLRPGTTTVYGYLQGDEDKIVRAYEWGPGKRQMPSCKRPEGA